MEFKHNYLKTKNKKLPTNALLWTAAGTIITMATLKCLGRKNSALLIGQLAVPILLFGLYDRIVKTENNGQQEITTLWTE